VPRPTRSHRRHRRPPVPPAGLVLHSPDEALQVVLAAAASPPEMETIVLLLDDQHRGATCLVCQGAAYAEQVAALVPVLVEAAAGAPALAAVALASVRPGHGIALAPHDEAAFAAMRRDLAEAQVDLLDWFVLDGDLIASVAELTGACWRWPAAEPRW
jgi:hypothetical protein